MFGIVRPCKHRLTEGMRAQWMAHLCGLCLSIRSTHGQFARIATNYDGLIISVLVEAQSPRTGGGRRTAGPCPLRGMRTQSVATGEGARLAAAVSLVLASAKVRDHIADHDGIFARPTVAKAARKVAGRWDRAGALAGVDLGFDSSVLVDAVARQAVLEQTPGLSLLEITEPTETATAAAFAHTATLAGCPDNIAPLAEAGRLFGRLAHLLDAVEDFHADRAAGVWNPLLATGTSRAQTRALCDDAVYGIRLALKEVRFTDRRLVHVLLAHELAESVDRVFGTHHARMHGQSDLGFPQVQGLVSTPGAQLPPPPPQPGGLPPYPGGVPPYGAPEYPPPNPDWNDQPAPGDDRSGWGRTRGPIHGCAVWLGLCCTCQLCCADYHDPWSGQPKQGPCNNCNGCDDCCTCACCCDAADGSCCDGCDCCDCCSCDC